MTNLAQLQALVTTIDGLVDQVQIEQNKLHSFKERIKSIVFSDPAMLAVIFPNDAAVNAFIAAQAPIYNSYLTLLETATDALGTDAFH